MRQPEVALDSSSARRPPAFRVLFTGSSAPPATVVTTANPSPGWPLSPLDQFMTLHSRFLAPRLSTTNTSSTSAVAGARNRRLLETPATLDSLLDDEDGDQWDTNRHFVLPHNMHFQDVSEGGNSVQAPLLTQQRPEEIDLTVSSSDDEGGRSAGTSDDVIEILETPSRAPPTRRKRRRPGAAADNALVKRQHLTDMMHSVESTNVSIRNNEVVEEFKRRLKCSICLDMLEDMTSTSCGHVFCAGCIHQAIRANGKCPLCQRRLKLHDTHRLFF